MYSFQLLNALFTCNPLATLQPYLPTIFNLLLQRMQASVKESKTVRFARLFLHALCVFTVAYGASVLCETLEAITSGLTGMLIQNIWSVNADKMSSGDDQEVKQTIVGATKLLTESPHIAAKPEIWGSLLKSAVVLVGKVSSVGTNTGPSADDLLNGDDEQETHEFDSAYSKLAYASTPSVDICSDVESSKASAYFGQQLAAFSGTHGQLFGLVGQVLTPPEAAVLQSVMQSR